MYNSSTEKKIKDLPEIAGIDMARLPQELTRIYALIVSIRRKVNDGSKPIENNSLQESLYFLHHLAGNLEIILLLNPLHPKKDAIAFVAATANSLIFKIEGISETDYILSQETISPYVSSIVLFLIGNSQADAAEMAMALTRIEKLSSAQEKLLAAIVALAKGNLPSISNASFPEDDAFIENDIESTAVNYLWRELFLGIKIISYNLLGQSQIEENNHFDLVIEYSKSDFQSFGRSSVLYGPYRLAKLLKLLAGDIMNRSLITTGLPNGVDALKWKEFLMKLAEERPYLWENHKDAIDTGFLDPGKSAVITLPTGAGKTTLSELKIASTIYSGGKVIYLVPTHALEDQISRNLRKLFPQFQSIGIEIDGEYTEIADLMDFPILVMTPERCLTLLTSNDELFTNIKLVAFDEFHLIHGKDIKKERRAIDAMYCLLLLFTTVPNADYLLISAMVENGAEVKAWIETITGRECKLFDSAWKPTRQLHGCIVFDGKRITEIENSIRREKADKAKLSSKFARTLTVVPECFFSLKNIWETEEDNDYHRTPILDHEILLGIGSYDNLTTNRNVTAEELAYHFASSNLKTLVFVNDPKTCKKVANSISTKIAGRESSYEEFLEEEFNTIESLAMELGDIRFSYFNDSPDVGVHHGLLLPIERYLTEGYFRKPNGSQVLVATATLAQGINLPAEIVVISGDERFDETTGRLVQVEPHELLNAAGRAGRAGLSSQGAVMLIPGKVITINGEVINRPWWQLKNKVFSKGDQCLSISDPLEYFLDSVQDETINNENEYKQLLYRLKPSTLSSTEAQNVLMKSFRGWKASKENQKENFANQVTELIKRRNDLDRLTHEAKWIKEISYKTGIDPAIINALNSDIEQEGIDQFLTQSVSELITWFLDWIITDEKRFEGVFTKKSVIQEFKRFGGLTLSKDYTTGEILDRISGIADVVIMYIEGAPFAFISQAISFDDDPNLKFARAFVLKLMPEISFATGIFSFVLTEKAKQAGIKKQDIPLDVRQLATCVREGFHSSMLLSFKKDQKLKMRVETHVAYDSRSK